jgi:hypothetical protein
MHATSAPAGRAVVRRRSTSVARCGLAKRARQRVSARRIELHGPERDIRSTDAAHESGAGLAGPSRGSVAKARNRSTRHLRTRSNVNPQECDDYVSAGPPCSRQDPRVQRTSSRPRSKGAMLEADPGACSAPGGTAPIPPPAPTFPSAANRRQDGRAARTIRAGGLAPAQLRRKQQEPPDDTDRRPGTRHRRSPPNARQRMSRRERRNRRRLNRRGCAFRQEARPIRHRLHETAHTGRTEQKAVPSRSRRLPGLRELIGLARVFIAS